MIFMKYIWLQIGSDFSNIDAGIYHRTCKEECPNQCTNQWKYWDKGWHVDSSIKISCGMISICDMILFLLFQTIYHYLKVENITCVYSYYFKFRDWW